MMIVPVRSSSQRLLRMNVIAAVLLLLLFCSNHHNNGVVLAQSSDCSSNSGCLNCVSAGCAWGIGTCFSSCDAISEVPCYSTSLTGGFGSASTSPEEICARQAQEAADAAFCGVQETCEDCTSTTLMSSQSQKQPDTTYTTTNDPYTLATTTSPETATTCSWYEDRQSCSHLPCDALGCASPYCPSSPEGQCYFGATDCQGCLELSTDTGNPCSWTGGSHSSCELNCLAMDGAVCYSPTLFAGQSNQEICETAANVEADFTLCSSQLDCASCTSAIKVTDGSSCEWYFDNTTQAGWCGMGGCDMNGLCGLNNCIGVPSTSGAGSFESCAGLSTLDSTDITCQACLEANCGWTGDSCLESCSVIADAACYSIGPAFGEDVTSVCYAAEQAMADKQTCSAIYECDICTAALLSDRRSTCQWFAESNYCGTPGCDQFGVCGNVTCGDTTGTSVTTGNGCTSYVSCYSCLSDTTLACAWINDSCQVDCNAVPGATCYSVAQFPALTNTDICNQAVSGSSGNQEVSSGATTTTTMVIMGCRHPLWSVVAVVVLGISLLAAV